MKKILRWTAAIICGPKSGMKFTDEWNKKRPLGKTAEERAEVHPQKSSQENYSTRRNA